MLIIITKFISYCRPNETANSLRIYSMYNVIDIYGKKLWEYVSL